MEICLVIFTFDRPTNQQTDTGENTTSQVEINTGGSRAREREAATETDIFLRERVETKPELKEEWILGLYSKTWI